MKKTLSFMMALAAVSTGCGKSETPTFSVVGRSSTPALLQSKGISERVGILDCSSPGITCGGSPTMLSMSFYKVWLSANADCSSPVLVADNGSSADAQDVTQGPTLFTGSPAAGTYQCVILQMTDTMSFKVDATAAAISGTNCSSTSATYQMDIYRTGESGWYNEDTGTTMSGSGTAASPGAQSVTIYVSTDITAITRGSVNPRLPLASPLVITEGTTTQTAFVADFNNGVATYSAGGVCTIETGTMAFVKL